MEYMLLIHVDASKFETLPEEAKSQGLAAYGAYTEALNKAGIVRGGNRLRRGNTATTVRVREGKTEVLQRAVHRNPRGTGRLYLIDVPDLDTALSWAARCPGASHGAVEVRPVWGMEAS